MNVKLIEKGLNLAKANPHLHRQSIWARKTSCGTAMCLAGWICVADGWNVTAEGMAWKRRGIADHVGIVAQRIADLTSEEENELFVMSAHDDITQLEARWERMKEDYS